MRPIRIIALVDVDAAGGIEPARLGRALTLAVRRTEPGRYEVTGGEEAHHVDLIDPTMERCDCADFIWRQVVCQHLIACLLREGDERIVRAAAHLLRAIVEENRGLRADLRRRTIVLTQALKGRVALATGIPVADLEFHRDRSTADVTVVHATTGELVGTLARPTARPEFVPHQEAAAHARNAA